MSAASAPAPSRGSRRSRAALAIALAFLAATGCFGERRGLSRDGLLRALDSTDPGAQLPTIEELLALRAPAPGGMAPPALVGGHALDRARDAASRGDIDGARAAWAEAAKAGGGDATDALLHRCLVESVLRHSEGVLEACRAFLERAPADARAIAAVRILVRTKFSASAASELIASRGPAWVLACAAANAHAQAAATGPAPSAAHVSCADLAFLVGEERIAQARVRKDPSVLAAAVAASGRVTSAVVEGPFDGDLRALFAADARGDALAARPVAGGDLERLPLDDEDGALAAAGYGHEGVYRLRAFVQGGGPATVYLTGARAARVRIDGVVVAERSIDVSSPAIMRAGVSLNDGRHALDVLVFAAGRGDTMTLALLDGAGSPLARHAGPGSPAATAALRRPEGAVEALTVSLGAGDDAAALEGLLLAQTVARAPTFGVAVDENQQIARVLARQFGWSPLALAVAAEAVGEDPALPERVSASLAGRLWREVKKRWPQHPVALISEARDLREERPDQALAAYRALVKAQPRYPFGHRELIELALAADLVDEALASANALMALDRSRENIDAAIPAIQAAGDAARVAMLVDERALLDEEPGANAAARRLLDEGRTGDALAALAEAARHGGSSVRDEHLALLALADAPAARRVVDAALARAAHDPELLLRRAQLAVALDGQQAGKRLLIEALPLLRRDERAVRFAEELGIAPPWWSRLALGDEVIRARRLAPSEPFPGHGSVALLDDVERIIEDDEGSIVVRHLIVELRSKEALDRFGEVSLDDERLVRLRVIKPDGSVVEPERHRGIDDISLPQLAPGDIVERLTVESDAPSRLGGNFEIRSLDGTATPALSRRYILSWPEGFDARRNATVFAHNDMAAPTQHHIVDAEGRPRVVTVFALANVEATSPEPFAPDRSETARTAGYAWGVDDALWARLRGASIARASQADGWLDDCARRIAGSGDDEDKLRRIFAFVARRIEPEASPDDADAVLAGGKGRRTALLLALLRGVGLDAEPVALQLPTQPSPATLDGDSWSILAVRVRVGDRAHYALIDGNAVLDALPAIARGSSVLDLSVRAAATPGAPLVTALPDAVIDGTPLKVQLDLALALDGERAGTLSGLLVVTVPAGKADGARRGVQRATQEQLRVVVERSLADSLPGVHVVEVKTPDVHAFGEPLRLGARIEVPVPELVDGTARFEHLFASGASGGLQLAAPFSAWLAVADRRLPALVAAEAEVLEVQITLPAKAAFVDAPQAASLRVGPFSMVQQVQITDGVLYWRREMSKDNGRVAVGDWASVRAGLAGIVALADARLSFAVFRGEVPSSAPTSRTSPDSQKQAVVDQNR